MAVQMYMYQIHPTLIVVDYLILATVSCNLVSGHLPTSFLVHRTVWPLGYLYVVDYSFALLFPLA